MLVRSAALVVVTVCGLGVVHGQRPRDLPPTEAGWRNAFEARPQDVATTGENPYFILKPGYQLTLEGTEDGKTVRLVVSVLNETKVVGGFETRVVEERETANGALSEISRNYFGIDKRSNDVYYFGEAVDAYKDGKIANHEGAWQHGANGAKVGLFMPGAPAVGMKFYQEVAPKVAMDRAAVVSVTDTITTPAGLFQNCLKIEETTPLEPGAKEYKIYAPGVGLVKDGSLLLVARPR